MMLFGQQVGGAGCWFATSVVLLVKIPNWPPVLREQGETKERGRHSRVVSGRCDMQGNLPMRLALGKHKYISVLLTRILIIFREALMGFSTYTYIVQMVSIRLYLLKATCLKWLLVQKRWTDHLS